VVGIQKKKKKRKNYEQQQGERACSCGVYWTSIQHRNWALIFFPPALQVQLWSLSLSVEKNYVITLFNTQHLAQLFIKRTMPRAINFTTLWRLNSNIKRTKNVDICQNNGVWQGSGN
jgi:hypothetical protein